VDSPSFDSLARSLAARKSRRGVLGSLAALGAGLLGVRGSDAQGTQAQCGNKICASNPGVCSDGCVCCVYPNGNSRCRPPGTCSPGTAVCPAGEVVDPVLGCIPSDGASCGTGLVYSGGECIGNGLCPTGDSFCNGGPANCGGQAGICGLQNTCATTPEGGSTCIFYPSIGEVCTGGPCSVSSDCADGYVCVPAGDSPCCGHSTGTCFQVCQDSAASRMAAPAGGNGTFGTDA
jgi:hypothetical protein